MLETSARLLRLLSLFQRRRYWAGSELADRLEITTRTLRRDVDKLRSLGYPIHSTAGVEGGYQLGAGSTMPPLLLDDDEAVAVAIGLQYATTAAVEGVGEIALRALAKMEQILPPRLHRRVTALHTVTVTAADNRSAVSATLLSTIAGACRDREQLRFRYLDNVGKASTRQVEPFRLVHTGRRWYLVAWDTDRQDWRTFRVDRVQGRATTGDRFPPREPPAKDLAAYVTKGVWQAPGCRARVKLLIPAEEAASRLPAWAGTIEPCDAGSCYLDTGAGSYENLAMHLALVGVDFQIIGPPELIAETQRLADRYHRAAQETVTRAINKE